MEVDIKDSQLSIFIEIGGKVYLVGMHKDKLDGLNALIKNSIECVVPTDKTQQDLRTYFGIDKVVSKVLN